MGYEEGMLAASQQMCIAAHRTLANVGQQTRLLTAYVDCMIDCIN